MPAFHSYAMIQTSHLTPHPSDPEPQAIPRKYMTSQSLEIPQGYSTCPQAPLEGFGTTPGAPGDPNEFLGKNLALPKKCWTHKIDVIR